MAGVFRAGSDEEVASLANTLAHGFGFPSADAPRWLAIAGHENVRVLSDGASVLGGLLQIPMAQRFGGRSVPTVGVAGVAIRPELRGQGLGRTLMLGLLREARANRIPLSTLYPATLTLYRAVGYERAGSRHRIQIDPRALALPPVPELRVREVEGCPDELRALYIETAGEGYLDRGPYAWGRVTHPRGKETKTFTFSSDAGLEAYAVISNKTRDGDGTTLELCDVAARSARGARAVLRFASEYRSLATELVWHGAAADLLTAVLPERHGTVTLLDTYMVRIACPDLALEARGYPKHLDATFTIELDDRSMPEASGRFSLRIAGGRATVTSLAAGESPSDAVVRTHERGLASLYSGHLSRDVLVRLGWLECSESAEALVDAAFAGPAPAMRDMF